MTRIIAIVCLFIISLQAQAQIDPVPKLIKQLKSKKADTRTAAMMALAELGPKAAPAVDALAAFLPRLDEEERILATMALGKIGKASLPAIEKLLGHEDETTRFYAVWSLALIGKDAKALTPRLLQMFAKDEEDDVRVKSAYALARIAPDSREVLSAFAKLAVMKEQFTPERSAAIEELRHFGKDAIEPLAQALQGELTEFLAIESLGHLLDKNKNPDFAAAVLPHLPDFMAKAPLTNPEVFAGDGLTYMLSANGDRLLMGLEKKLDDKNPQTHRQALTALSQMGSLLVARVENPELVKKIVTVLGPRFGSPDLPTRLILAQHAPLNDATQAAFEKLLLDDELSVRQQASSKFQIQGIDVTPKLQAGLKAAKGDEKLRYLCGLYTLTHDPELLKQLWTHVQHKDAGIRHRIACQLAADQFPVEDGVRVQKTLIPVLLDSMKNGSAPRRLQATQALLSVQLYLSAHVPELMDRLDDASPEVRLALLAALQNCENHDPQRSLKSLTPLVGHEDVNVRMGVIGVLTFLQKQGVPLLVQIAQKDKEQVVWTYACDQLGGMGTDAQAAIPALLKMAESEDRGPAALYAVARLAPEQNFPKLFGLMMKRDEALRKSITYPPAIWESPAKLPVALLEDWKKSDLERSRAIAQALVKIVPLLPPKQRDAIVLTGSPLLSEQLKNVDRALKAKEAKERLAALTMLGELRSLSIALQPAGPDWQKKEWMEFQQRYGEQSQALELLLARARMDSDLPVRRAARKLQATNLTHGFGMMIPPGMFPGFGPFPR